jgi:hypothetical protein
MKLIIWMTTAFQIWTFRPTMQSILATTMGKSYQMFAVAASGPRREVFLQDSWKCYRRRLL